jgi:hypothetical protein
MDDLQWSARGQLCEHHVDIGDGARRTCRIGVFETQEYAARAAVCVNACRGIDTMTLLADGVVPWGISEAFDLVAHLYRQREFSERTFGPGARTQGVIGHIRKELAEIEAKPDDVEEWIDVVLLALDGAWRAGHAPEAIVAALQAKQKKNERRAWPDWRTASPDQAIEHVKEVA